MTTAERGLRMTNEELDVLWFRAMEDSIRAGEQFTRYRFAHLVSAVEREECAKVCEARFMGDLNREDIEARRCAQAIRERSW
jgi:hypothetical protein